VALEQTLLTALEDGLEAADDADAATIGRRDETADDELWFSLPTDLSIGGITPAAIPAQSQSRRAPLPPPSRARSIGNAAALGKRSIAELLASPPPRLPNFLRTVPTAAAWGTAVQPSPNLSPGAEAAQLSPGQTGDNKRIISPPANRGSGGSAVAASSPAPSQSAGPNRWSSPPRPRVGSPKPSNGAYTLPATVGSPPSASASKERTLWLEIQSLRAAAAASAALELRLTRDNEALRAQCAAASEDAAASVAAAEDALRSMQEHMRASLDAQHQAVEDSARARTAAAAAQAAQQASAEATATAEARARDAEAQVRALSQQVVQVTEQRDQALVAAESATEANRAVSLDMAAANGRLDAAVRETARLTALVDQLNREEALSGMAHTVNILHDRTDGLAVFAMKRAQAARLRMAFRGWRAATAHAWAIAAGAELSARSHHRETEKQMFFSWRDITRNARHSDVAARRAGALNARIQLNGLRRCLHAWSRIARAGSTVSACEHVSMAVMQEQVETLTQRLETSEQEQRVRDEMHRQGIAKLEELAVEKQRLLDIALQEARARASAAEQRSAAYRKEAQSAARAAAESAASSADAAVADAISARRSAASEVSRLNFALDEAQRAASLAQAAATRAQRERDSALAALSDAERRLNLRERRKFETAVAQRPASPGLHAASRSRPASPTRSARGSGEDGQRLPSLGPPQPPAYGAMQPVPPPFRSAVAPQPLFGSQASSSPAMQRAQLTTLRVARVRV
jgi:trimeric autotransporter adhesin